MALRQRLSLGLVSRTATYWNYYAAQSQGFYRAQGLEVEPVLTGSTQGTLEALRRGWVQVGAMAPNVVIAAVEMGEEMRVVGGVVNRQASSVVAAPEVGGFADLRGQPVALGLPSNGTALLFRAVLARQGLLPGTYVAVENMGSTPELVQGLLRGEIKAALLTQPFDYQLLERGFRRLALTSEVIPHYPFATLNVALSWAQGHRVLLVAFLRATEAAGRWLHDPAHAEESIAVLAEATGLEERFARQTHRLYFQEVRGLARGAEVEPWALHQVAELMGEAGLLPLPLRPPETYLDLSYLAAARAMPGEGG